MIKKNNQTIGTIYKGDTLIGKIYKGTVLVYEAWKKLVKQGLPPLTLTKCKENKLLNYQIYGNSKQGELPDGYTQVEYIESTGTQYIDTGLKGGLDTFGVNFKFNVSNSAWYYVLGNFNQIGQSGIMKFTSEPTLLSLVYYIEGVATRVAIGSVNMDIVFSNINGNIMSNGELKGTIPNNTMKLTNSNLCIYGTGTGQKFDGAGKVYYLKVYSNLAHTNLIRNFIPCYRKSDNVAGMYDTVNNVFYTNAGTGDFTAGPEMPNPDSPIEIQSVGDKTKNSFDENTHSLVQGYYINLTNGEINRGGANTSGSYDYFEIDNIETITISNNENAKARIAFYDENKDFISSLNYAYTFSIPSNAKYYRFSIQNDNPTKVQIEKGSTVTDYEPYGYKIPVNAKGENLWKGLNYYEGNATTRALRFDLYPSVYPCIKAGNTIAISATCYLSQNDTRTNPRMTCQLYYVDGTYGSSYFSWYSKGQKERVSQTVTIPSDKEVRSLIVRFTDYSSNAGGVWDGYVEDIQIYEENLNRTTNIYLDEPLRKIGNADAVKLPSGYTQLEYIQSSGTQYIDTGFKPTGNTKVILKYITPTQNTTQQEIFGARDGSTKRFSLFTGAVKNGLQADYNIESSLAIYTQQIQDFDENSINIVEMSNYLSLNGNTINTIDKVSFQNTQNMYLFANNDNGGAQLPMKGQIYYFRIYDNDTLVRNFIPCKNSSGTIGMYDIVNDTFYTNQGTGTFTAGPQIYADYIDYENQKVYRQIGNIKLGNNIRVTSTTVRTNTIRAHLRIIGAGDKKTNDTTISQILCTHGNGIPDYYYYKDEEGICELKNATMAVIIVSLSLSKATTAQEVLQWLIDNNVYLNYILNEPTEESVELPDILLNAGTNIVDVETSLTPSNLLVKYKGKE